MPTRLSLSGDIRANPLYVWSVRSDCGRGSVGVEASREFRNQARADCRHQLHDDAPERAKRTKSIAEARCPKLLSELDEPAHPPIADAWAWQPLIFPSAEHHCQMTSLVPHSALKIKVGELLTM